MRSAHDHHDHLVLYTCTGVFVLWRYFSVLFLFCDYLQSVSVSALDGVSLAAEAAGIVRLEPTQSPTPVPTTTPTITIRVRNACK